MKEKKTERFAVKFPFILSITSKVSQADESDVI